MTDTPASDIGPIADGLAFDDLTARARIREAALQHFAADGYERATIRAIAQTARVSPALIRHHYGSKDDLHQACDNYVSDALRRLNAQLLGDPASSAQVQQTSNRFGRYLARSLVDGSPTGGAIFDDMVTLSERWISRADAHRPDPPEVERRVRAALVTAMAVGIPLLHEHVSRALGVDLFSAEGDRLVALGLLDIYSHALIDLDTASAAETGYQG